ENRGKTPVILIRPGDGSDCGWRTPITGWSVIDTRKPSAKHPATPRLNTNLRCGNLDPFSPKELFTLLPGKRMQIMPYFYNWPYYSPGRYRVVFYYINDPTKQWNMALGEAPVPPADRLIKGSTACRLRSNELILTIKNDPRNKAGISTSHGGRY